MAFNNINRIFDISSPRQFSDIALEVFKFQYENLPLYREFCNHLNKSPSSVKQTEDIPFLPISFFKNNIIAINNKNHDIVFLSSGTTGTTSSKHYVVDVSLYEKSFLTGFEHFYGDPSDYCILALLPSYLEREGSSLVYMTEKLINITACPDSGFYLNDIEALTKGLLKMQNSERKILLIGVSFALLEMAEIHTLFLPSIIVMETGGMKGRRKEILREELHKILCKGFGVSKIHSEYGMTELLSQAYSKGEGVFECPPWMKVQTRGIYDPLEVLPHGTTGAINIIDLANVYSCSFIATDDIGFTCKNNCFEITGRLDASDMRGCNLLI